MSCKKRFYHRNTPLKTTHYTNKPTAKNPLNTPLKTTHYTNKTPVKSPINTPKHRVKNNLWNK